ncbi:MAG: CotH kinase family protein, partial [Phycisphaeraceae bacterium]|nr:CotH kinase family protein [Phycisphaeraceae bacterium]
MNDMFPVVIHEIITEFDGFVEEVYFSHERGFYETPFSISLFTATEGATIYYTVDGRAPGVSSDGRYVQTVGEMYQGPIPITTTTCLRAIAYKAGWKSSRIVSHTYLFLADVAMQRRTPQGFPNAWGAVTADYEMDPDIVNDPRYADRIIAALESLPSMSIVMNVDDLFGTKGIYSNSGSGGVNWERPASVELACPDGQEGFQVDCGIRIQGGAFRNPGASPKHSFRLLFKGLYGSTKLRYPLFGPAAEDEFDTITLRAGANDGYVWSGAGNTAQYVRDQFIRDLQRDTGQASPNGIFVHLYVNGLYWGLYNPVERPDDAFSASYYGGEKEDWDVFRHKGFERNAGESDALNQMRLDCGLVGNSNEAYQRLQGNHPDGSPNPEMPHLLDVPNYIDYLIVNYWGGNWDWPWNNYWLARKRTADSTGFKFYCWDAEDVLESPRSYLTIDKVSNPDSREVGEFHSQLAGNPEYRLLFADRVHRLFSDGGILTPDVLVERYARLAEGIELAMITESARWGDQHRTSPLSLPEWTRMRDQILQTYLPQRSGIVLEQFRQAGLYPDFRAPVFNIDGIPRLGGHVATTESLTMVADAAIWVTLDGSDPRIPGRSGPLEHTVILEEGAAKRMLVPEAEVDAAWRGGASFDASDWIAGSGGVGYELGAGYEDYYTTDLFDQMFYVNASCYIRIPFDLSSDASQWASLVLRVRYDDGFVAYLNGVEVARDHA